MSPFRVLPALAIAALCIAPLSAQVPLTARDSARHALQRLAYGPTPGEVDAVVDEGVQRWIDRQLSYDQVSDPQLDDLARHFDVLQMSSADMLALQRDNLAQRARARRDSDSGQPRPRDLDKSSGRRTLRELLQELPTVTVIRAVSSDRQLAEVLTDFWVNHFNVYINKSQDRAFFADYLEHTIRGHALGSFEDLLVATARSPAMLFYLDNAESVADGSDVRIEAMRQQAIAARERRRATGGGRVGSGVGTIGRHGAIRPGAPTQRNAFDRPGTMTADTQRRANARMPHGLNENYGRELMELHTLGVDGGYTQADVIAVARVLTGWGIDGRSAKFAYHPLVHDNGAKMVLGVGFDAGHGEDEGVRLLKMLANSPATMHHVSAELCAKFVSDVPPDGCVDDAVRAWKASGGEIRSVLRAIIMSHDFWAPSTLDSKIKTPLEFVVSALRAVDGVPDSTPRVAQQIALLGEPLFQHQTPDGYGERQEDWVNSGALLARMNFAVQLASGRMRGVTVKLDRVAPVTNDHVRLVAAIDSTVLGGAMTDHTRETILKELADVADPTAARALAIGLAIGGPEFQRQ